MLSAFTIPPGGGERASMEKRNRNPCLVRFCTSCEARKLGWRLYAAAGRLARLHAAAALRVCTPSFA